MKSLNINLKRKNKKLRGGIRSRLVLGLTLFVIMVLIIVWIFQVLLLDFFYEKTKLLELRSVQNGIDSGIESGDLEEICGDLAAQYDVCIVIYSVSNDKLNEPVISKEVSPACIIHYTNTSFLETLYDQALNSGGTIFQRFSLDPREYGDNRNKRPPQDGFKEEAFEPNDKTKDKFNDELIIAVSVRAFSDNLGNDYAAFINLQFTPVNTIQNTRNIQFAYIAIMVIASSIVLALIFSSRIARPLEKMTVSAERMASGLSAVDFAVEGYRETKQLAEALNYAVSQIARTDKLQRELVANVSHDLRTPLTLISGYAEMMRDIPGENTPENSQLIIDETKRLTGLVNDILDFSKYSSGTEQPILKVFNLTDSINSVIGRYAEFVKAHGYKIQFLYDKDVHVSADERMILQVLYNLVNNAINYTGGDKTVRIKQEIDLEGNVKISISDSGSGIAKEDIEQIWDRYYKIDKTHMRAVSGSGLGLSIVSKLLQIHSSTYGVESSAASGTTFWFTLKPIDE